MAPTAIATPAPAGGNPGATSAASGHGKTREGSGSTETNEATREPTGGETRPAPIPATPPAQANLGELWQQILASLELPSTRMLLSQQATLHRLDERRAVVRVAGNWIAMVQSRLPLLEGAMAKTLGSPRQVTLEAGDTAQPGGPATDPAPERLRIVEATTAPKAPAESGTFRTEINGVTAGEPLAHHHPAGHREGPAPVAPTAGTAQAEPFGRPAEPQAPLPSTPGNPAFREPSRLDQKARQLAVFFNGDVIEASPGP
jgi:DNA polymerase-3 subunit gamma/tau